MIMYSDLLDECIKSQIEIIQIIQAKLIRTDAKIDLVEEKFNDDNRRLATATETLQRLIMCKNA